MGLDLQSGQSYWLIKNTHLPVFPELDHDDRAAVVVIGAGITGALAAAVLVEAGIDVIVLDRRALGAGSTGASTALLSHEPDLTLAQLSARRGHDVAVRSYQLACIANEALARLIEQLHIQCSFERATSVHLARTLSQVEELREEHRLRNANDLPCELVEGRVLASNYGLVAQSALISGVAGQLDPVRLTEGLMNHVMQNGSRCYRAFVTGVDRDADGGFSVRTKHGSRIKTRYVVHATGYETQLELRQPAVHLASTFVIATDVTPGIPEWLRTAILWDMDSPYHYARCADGRILVGGGDEPFVDESARDALMPDKAGMLHQYLQHILPGVTAACFSTWCGTFARTDDSLPYIGEHPKRPGELYTLGYGGNGITFGMLGALLLRDAIQGRPNDDIGLFSFERDQTERSEDTSVVG